MKSMKLVIIILFSLLSFQITAENINKEWFMQQCKERNQAYSPYWGNACKAEISKDPINRLTTFYIKTSLHLQYCNLTGAFSDNRTKLSLFYLRTLYLPKVQYIGNDKEITNKIIDHYLAKYSGQLKEFRTKYPGMRKYDDETCNNLENRLSKSYSRYADMAELEAKLILPSK